MSWTTPFVILRINDQGQLYEVAKAEDIKKAKYWLTYIAQEFDLLCKTPLHPKHTQKSQIPEYWGHKSHGGSTEINEVAWKEYAKSVNWNQAYPEITASQVNQ